MDLAAGIDSCSLSTAVSGYIGTDGNMEITINGNKNNVSKESFISLIASELVSI